MFCKENNMVGIYLSTRIKRVKIVYIYNILVYIYIYIFVYFFILKTALHIFYLINWLREHDHLAGRS